MIAGRRVDVCLVSMPYAALPRPSLALGLLKAVLEDAGLAAVALYPNLWFAERVGIRRYHLCSAQTPTEFLTGEWTFAEAAFPGAPRDDEGYLRAVGASVFRVQAYRGPDAATRLVAELRALREAATGFVDEAARRVLATGARIVGCTSTFEQHVPSLALLRRVRELDPSVITLLGGANCETVMGEATHRHFPAVDYLVSGEADGLIGALCHDILRRGRDIPVGELPPGVLGPRHRDPAEARAPLPRALFRDLNALPVPDFGDYFAALQGSALGEAVTPGLPLETSRGCWWGALHHCTFCGLNGSSMGYRSKAPERVLSEVRELEQRYAISGFETVDNILDMGYFRSVLPGLAGDGVPRRIFYEVKANLKRAQVKELADSGINWIQPGIESLHTGVLRLMDKGVQGWQNVQLLRFAREFGVRMSWGMLWGFPGEEDHWYAQVACWIPLLEHLQAPSGLIRLRYDRYSVYHNRAGELGLRLQPIPALRFVYPLPPEELHDLAYFFIEEGGPDAFGLVGGYSDILGRRPGLAAVLEAVTGWRRAFWKRLPPVLSMTDDGEALEVLDTRGCALATRTRLGGLMRDVLLACDEAPGVDRLAAAVASADGTEPPAEALAGAVGELKRLGFVLEIDRRLVALPVRGNLPELPRREDFPGGFVEDRPGAPAPAYAEA